MFFIV